MNPLSLIKNLFGKKKPAEAIAQAASGALPPSGGLILGTPQFNPYEELEHVQGQMDENDAYLAKLRKDQDATIGQLQRPAPQLESSDPNAYETIAGLVGMISGGGQRALNAPMILGANRAQSNNELAQRNYELQQQAQRAILQGQQAMIGQAMTRESALDRVREQIVTKQLANNARNNVAKLRQDGQFWQVAAKLISEGKGDADALAGAYQMMNPAADPREIQAAVEQMVGDPMTAQNIFQATQQQKVENDAAKIQQSDIESARKTARDPNATRFDKAEAYWTLQQAGKLPPNFDINKAIESEGSVTQKNEAQAAKAEAGAKLDEAKATSVLTMLPHQVRQAVAKLNLTSQQTALLGKRVATFDQEFQARVAQRWATVANSKNQKDSMQAINGLKSIYQKQIDALDKKKTASMWKPEVKWTTADETRLGELYGEMENIEAHYQAVIGDEGGYTPVQPDIPADWGGKPNLKPGKLPKKNNRPPSPDRQPSQAGTNQTTPGGVSYQIVP